MIIRQGKPNRVCIHHSAVSPGASNLAELKRRLASYEITHSKKSWAENIKTGGEHGYRYLEYHLAVARNGEKIRCQDDKYVLYHAGDNFRGDESFNLHGIAILIDGNYQDEFPTEEQKRTVAEIIADFEKQYKIDVIVRGHKETSKTATSCPGLHIGTHDNGWMGEVITEANNLHKEDIKMVKLSKSVQISTKNKLHPSVDLVDMVEVSKIKVKAKFNDGSPFEREYTPTEEVIVLTPEVDELKKKINGLYGTLNQEKLKNEQNEQKLKELSKITTELKESKEIIENQKKTLSQYASEVIELDKRYKESIAEGSALEKAYGSLNDKYEKLGIELSNITEDREYWRVSFDNLVLDCKVLENNIAKMNAWVSILEAERNQLKDLLDLDGSTISLIRKFILALFRR